MHAAARMGGASGEGKSATSAPVSKRRKVTPDVVAGISVCQSFACTSTSTSNTPPMSLLWHAVDQGMTKHPGYMADQIHYVRFRHAMLLKAISDGVNGDGVVGNLQYRLLAMFPDAPLEIISQSILSHVPGRYAPSRKCRRNGRPIATTKCPVTTAQHQMDTKGDIPDDATYEAALALIDLFNSTP